MSTKTAPARNPAQGGSLKRITVNLTPRADKALTDSCDLTGDSKTDTINRALLAYAYIQDVISKGGSILSQDADGDAPERLRFL